MYFCPSDGSFLLYMSDFCYLLELQMPELKTKNNFEIKTY